MLRTRMIKRILIEPICRNFRPRIALVSHHIPQAQRIRRLAREPATQPDNREWHRLRLRLHARWRVRRLGYPVGSPARRDHGDRE